MHVHFFLLQMIYPRRLCLLYATFAMQIYHAEGDCQTPKEVDLVQFVNDKILHLLMCITVCYEGSLILSLTPSDRALMLLILDQISVNPSS